MTSQHEPRLEAPPHAVDHRFALVAVAALERQQVDFEDLTHDPNASDEPSPSGRPGPTVGRPIPAFGSRWPRRHEPPHGVSVVEARGVNTAGRPPVCTNTTSSPAPPSGGGVAEQAGEPLAGVGPVEHPAAVACRPGDRLVAGRRRDGVIVAEPAVVELDVVVADVGASARPIIESASRARAATSGWPATTPLATPIANTGGASARPAIAATLDRPPARRACHHWMT